MSFDTNNFELVVPRILCGIYAIFVPCKKMAYVGESIDIHNRLLTHTKNVLSQNGESSGPNFTKMVKGCTVEQIECYILEVLPINTTKGVRLNRECYWADRISNETDYLVVSTNRLSRQTDEGIE